MRRTIAFSTAVMLSVTASAQSPPADAFDVCAQKTDSAARLACFDQEMQRRRASDAPRAPATRADDTARAATPQSAPPRDSLHEPRVSKEPRLANEPRAAKEPPQSIVAKVSKSVSHPDHRYTLLLDNGQVWEQVDSRPGLYFTANDTVTISSAALGAFFLETSNRQFLRVRRVQ